MKAKNYFQSASMEGWITFLITEPSEGNINVLMYSDTNSVTKRVSPKGFNIRSKVHEYGEDPSPQMVTISSTVISMTRDLLTSFLSPSNTFSTPVAVTDSLGDKVRYADLTIDRKRNRLIAVREDHRFIKRVWTKQKLVNYCIAQSGGISN